MRRSVALATVLILVFTAQLFAVGEARITGKVLDAEGNPIVNATIDVNATEAKTWHQTFKTNKKGEYSIFVLDGTIHYKFTVASDGYVPYEETMKLMLIPEKNERDFKLNKVGQGQPAEGGQQVQTQQAKADPAVTAYNDGAALANNGDEAGAIRKFEEAVTLNDQLGAGYSALTRMYAKNKNWNKAIENGQKALAIDPDQPDLNSVLADAYTETGDKTKAAEYRKKAPANPAALFNDAARAINAGKDSEAEPLLKQAIAADDTFAKAYYELGMVYARMSKNADARANLEKYISLEPNGKDVSTAREMMKYLQ
ncbi:MAG: tetratricopeptide repeat protein [Acidobacteriota bacterium]